MMTTMTMSTSTFSMAPKIALMMILLITGVTRLWVAIFCIAAPHPKSESPGWSDGNGRPCSYVVGWQFDYKAKIRQRQQGFKLKKEKKEYDSSISYYIMFHTISFPGVFFFFCSCYSSSR
mmetsp:Transcript_34590/g.38859  ORF Transcript_34590/g.38859 Transcript_34590/m.38859 type:complete len:120 (+) Transcript_34590:2506-2865(+)